KFRPGEVIQGDLPIFFWNQRNAVRERPVERPGIDLVIKFAEVPGNLEVLHVRRTERINVKLAYLVPAVAAGISGMAQRLPLEKYVIQKFPFCSHISFSFRAA